VRKTDAGTIVLHWSLVFTLFISVVTGWRIAADNPDGLPGQALDWMLPQWLVWGSHIPAATILISLAVGYALYIAHAGLFARIRPDRARLMGMRRRGPTRWGALNVILYWCLFITLLAQFVTGGLLYLGYGGRVVTAHRYGMWAILLFAILHVFAHWRLGGVTQLVRVLRPSRLAPPPPYFNPADLPLMPDRAPLVPDTPEPDVETIAPQPSGNVVPLRPRRSATLHANPIAVALAGGLATATVVVATDRVGRETLPMRKTSAPPQIDGDLSDPAWRAARTIVVPTQQGANFDGAGASEVEIRAVHDGQFAYFAFVWTDPTRSLKHLPLIKKADGWYLLNEGYGVEDEDAYYEDKFAVLLSNGDALAGDGSAHLGQAPLRGKPAAFSGRGLHYTTDDSVVDVWHWKATRGGLLGFMDDNFFGPPAAPTANEIQGASRYKAGYGADPGKAFYANNFTQRPPGGYDRSILPKRLPRDPAAMQAAMGRIDPSPQQGESEGARWWMTEAESAPYSLQQDARFALGAIIPGVLIGGEYAGDRADVRCAARWAAGRWTLEVARRLDTGSRFDVPISSNTFMWVAAFDHSQTRHTRHMRPVRLELE
jgi:hypothetical protein